MKALQIVKYSLLATLLVAIGLFLHYNLPRTDVVQIIGTDVKRIDRQKPEEGTHTRDVRYLNVQTLDGKIRVFRNEDTGWGWPPYFKFGSADVTARAQTLAQDPEKPWVRIRYYGWRVTVFSVFPNAISLKVVDKDYSHIPWFNILFLASLAAAAFFAWRTMRRLLDRMRGSERYRKVSRSVGDLLEKRRPRP